MAEATDQGAATEDLDERVQTLLKEVDAECERLGRRAEDAAASENEPEATTEIEQEAAPETPATEDGGAPETDGGAEAEAQPVGAADEAGPSLDDQVNALVEEAEALAADGSGEPAPSAGLNPELNKLDEDLARITDDMLDGEFEAPDGTAETAPEPEATEPAKPEATEPEQPVANEPAHAPEPPAPDQQAPAPAAASVVETVEGEADDPLVRADEATGRVAVAVDFLSRLGSLARRVWSRAIVPGSIRAATAMSRPLSNRPPMIRDTVGWIAVYTLFLAVCVWSFVLIFRQPEAPEAGSAPARMLVDESAGRGAIDARQ